MIRTNSVPITRIPNAIAYRIKMASGDAGIVIIRGDEPQPGTATISRSTGEPIVSSNTPGEAYPKEAFAEAIELTQGMPYRKQGKPAAPEMAPLGDDGHEEAEEELPEEVVVNSDDYNKVVDAYTDKRGRLSYELLNRDLIQLAHKSEVVAKMVSDGEGEEAIRRHVVGTRIRGLTGNRNLTDAQVDAIASLLDEVSAKGAFKELNSKIRNMLGKAKPKRQRPRMGRTQRDGRGDGMQSVPSPLPSVS